MKKVLYLHGLNSGLHEDRRSVLEAFDLEIFSPKLDYEKDNNVWNYLVENYNPDFIIGSSAGGLAGFYLSGYKNIPALLFNPALPFRHYLKEVPNLPKRNQFLQIVLGARDTVVSPTQTMEFLTQEFDKEVPMEIHWINQMEHALPITIFEKEVRYFLSQIP